MIVQLDVSIHPDSVSGLRLWTPSPGSISGFFEKFVMINFEGQKKIHTTSKNKSYPSMLISVFDPVLPIQGYN